MVLGLKNKQQEQFQLYKWPKPQARMEEVHKYLIQFHFTGWYVIKLKEVNVCLVISFVTFTTFQVPSSYVLGRICLNFPASALWKSRSTVAKEQLLNSDVDNHRWGYRISIGCLAHIYIYISNKVLFYPQQKYCSINPLYIIQILFFLFDAKSGYM